MIVSPNVVSRAQAAVVQPDGKVVLAGFVADRTPHPIWWTMDFLALRLNLDGGLDQSFGTGGIVQTPIDLGGTNWDHADAVALGPDGSVVLAGKAWKNTGEADLAFVRYTPSGALDTSFSGNGILTINMGPDNALGGVAVQPDGKIVAVGHARSGFMVIRLLPNGTLDQSFGAGGIVDTNVGDSAYRDSAAAVVVLGDGKIVVAGTSGFDYPSYTPVSMDFAVVRYLPDGQRDPTFGSEGIVVTPGPKAEVALGLAPAPDGKIVVAGYGGWPTIPRYTNGESSFQLARYLPSGALDGTFGAGGTVTTSFDTKHAGPSSIVVEPNGKIIAGGTVFSDPPAAANPKFAVAAYNVDGSLDETFGVGGRRTYDLLSGADFGYALAIQPAAARSGADRLVFAGDSSAADSTEDHVVAIGIDLGQPPPPPPARCRVPRVGGLTLSRARVRIRSAHCTVGHVRRVKSIRPRGTVILQRPRPGRRLPRGSRVNLVVSRGR